MSEIANLEINETRLLLEITDTPDLILNSTETNLCLLDINPKPDLNLIVNPSYLYLDCTSDSHELNIDNINTTLLEIAVDPICKQGEKGEPGESFRSEVYDVTIPVTNFIVNHNKGYYPSIIILNENFEIISACVKYNSVNQIEVNTDIPFLGKIIVN